MYTPDPKREYQNYILWHARQALGRYPMSYDEWLVHQLAPAVVEPSGSDAVPAFLRQQAD